MFFNGSKKKSHPYATLAVFTLAASAVIGIFNKGKRFVGDKLHALMRMMKRESE